MTRFLAAFFLLHLLFATAGYADTLFKPETNCTRSYIYRNRTFPVDSSRKPDAEGLRHVLRKNSQSEYLLNRYQSSLKASNIPAYFGTGGAIGLAVGLIYASKIESPLGKRDTKTIVLPLGIGMILGSYFFGQYFISSNQKTLEKAVDTYNDAAEEKERIQVGFTPMTNGDGGQIKTIVPF